MPEYTSYVFLLGGYDLEMVEIKQLLINLGIRFHDKRLHWNNAKLSAYKRNLNNEEHFVGIELQSDIELPANYTLIDHHNERSDSPSSIEQVATMLNLQLIRDQQLVAANDKGYIPAMEQMHATKEEIADIRKRDREAQGITEQDEKLAIKSINHHKQQEGGTIIIKSLTSKFAAITDFLYPNYKSLLIHTDTELTYYGLNALNLERLIDKTKFTGSVYSGGGENGYWGISKSKITKKIVNQILNIINMEPFSKHIFLFPFKLKFEEKDKKGDDFIEYLKNLYPGDPKKTNPWKEKSSDNDSDILYNEKKFFHDFVNPAIFDDTETHKKIGKIRYREDREIRKLEYPTTDFQYKIGIYKKDKEDISDSSLEKKPKNTNKIPVFEKVEISLALNKVTLDIKDKIGIFAFHLEYYPISNDKKELLDNVLLINQYGRRLFAPFYDRNYKNFGKVEIKNGKEHTLREVRTSLEGVKFREMPDYIEILKKDKSRFANEDWKEEKKPFKCISYIPTHILEFLKIENKPEENFYQSQSGGEKINLDLIPVLDDRMFVLCWLGAEQLKKEFKEKRLKPSEEKKQYGNVLSNICERQPGGFEAGGFHRNANSHKYLAINRSFDGYGYVTNDYWYQFMFVDGLSKTCQNELLQQKLAATHTYDRWVESYSLIGVTRYSFVMMTAPLDELKKPDVNAAFLPDYFTTIYFRMVSLVLLQRSMILDYSEKITRIDFNVTNVKEKEKENYIAENFIKVRDIYENYRSFINKVYFREVTAQEQGIELYDMLQEHLRVEKQAKELEKEFDELHRLMNLLNEEQKKENEKVMKVLEENKQDKLKYFAMIISSVAILSLILNLLKSKEFSDLPYFDNYNSKVTFSNDSVFLLLFIFVFALLLTHLIRVMYPFKQGDSQKISLGWKIGAVISVLIGFVYFLIARQFPIVTISYFVLGALCILPLIFHIINCIKNRKSKKQTVNQNKP
jgi:hypothetical protein